MVQNTRVLLNTVFHKVFTGFELCPKMGHYLPNPLLQLRTHSSEGLGWRPIFEVLNLPWVDAGTTRSVSKMQQSLAILVERARARATAGEDLPEVF